MWVNPHKILWGWVQHKRLSWLHSRGDTSVNQDLKPDVLKSGLRSPATVSCCSTSCNLSFPKTPWGKQYKLVPQFCSGGEHLLEGVSRLKSHNPFVCSWAWNYIFQNSQQQRAARGDVWEGTPLLRGCTSCSGELRHAAQDGTVPKQTPGSRRPAVTWLALWTGEVPPACCVIFSRSFLTPSLSCFHQIQTAFV